jgi:hypothetical protein
MLDKFLGGDGLRSGKSEFWKEDDTKDEKLQYDTKITPNEILDEIIASTNPIREDRREKWTIIVFSETFFSSDPWNSVEVEKVKKCCRSLTEKHKNLLISANFLHKYEGASDTPSLRKLPRESFLQTTDEYKRKLKQNVSSNLRFSNCSLIFWNGISLSCYRKASYKDECNVFVNDGCGYDFGDFKSYPTLELQTASENCKEFAKLFNSGRKQVIAARTCSDMNHTPKLSKQIKLLLLTADDAPPRISWKDKIGNAKVCYCDASYACAIMIPPDCNAKSSERVGVSSFIECEIHCALAIVYGDCDE